MKERVTMIEFQFLVDHADGSSAFFIYAPKLAQALVLMGVELERATTSEFVPTGFKLLAQRPYSGPVNRLASRVPASPCYTGTA
jgi:hypothetical protein